MNKVVFGISGNECFSEKKICEKRSVRGCFFIHCDDAILRDDGGINKLYFSQKDLLLIQLSKHCKGLPLKFLP